VPIVHTDIEIPVYQISLLMYVFMHNKKVDHTKGRSDRGAGTGLGRPLIGGGGL